MIKKLLIVACVVLGTTVSAHAQKRFTPGVRGGLSLTNLTHADADYKPDFYIGLQFPIHLARFYTLQPEINYTRQGAKNANLFLSQRDYWNSSIYYGKERNDISLSYIDLNVINKFRFEKLNIHVGPGLAILTSGSKYTDYNADLTFNLGVGYKITDQIEVEARWRGGMVTIVDTYDYWDYGTYYSVDEVVLNTGFQIGLNFTF